MSIDFRDVLGLELLWESFCRIVKGLFLLLIVIVLMLLHGSLWGDGYMIMIKLKIELTLTLGAGLCHLLYKSLLPLFGGLVDMTADDLLREFTGLDYVGGAH